MRITPDNESHWLELRKKDVTSTEVSALFGCSPYMTRYELYHLKAGNIEDTFKANKRSNAGKKLEEAIAAMIIEEHFEGKEFSRCTDYFVKSSTRCGSSIDYISSDETEILEIKNVDYYEYKKKWNEGREAPPHIELQAQHQMLCTGASRVYIAPFVGGNDMPKPLVREPIQSVFSRIQAAVGAFWDSIALQKEPPWDEEKDPDIVSLVNTYAEPGSFKLIEDAESDISKLVADHYEKRVKKRALEKELKTIKAKIIDIIGETERVEVPGYKLSATMSSGGPVSFTRKPYRNFRITERK